MGESVQRAKVSIPNAARNAINDFTTKATTIIESGLRGATEDPVPQIVYHYTSDFGLHGILQSGTLWLTNVFSLNDPSELIHGYRRATNFFAESARKHGGDFERDFAAAFGNNIEEKFKRSAQYFCCSFSKVGNDLCQWRAYANDATGYSLGFDRVGLEGLFKKMEHPAVFPVCYDEDRLDYVSNGVIDLFFPLLTCFFGSDLRQFEKYCDELQMSLAKQLLLVCLHFKHHAYENENEHRFLRTQEISCTHGVKTRPRHHELIKYCEFAWRSAGAGILKKIMVGPAADYEKARAFAEQCLKDFGYGDVEIVPSGIPYRSCSR